jgi:hypothetical protein
MHNFVSQFKEEHNIMSFSIKYFYGMAKCGHHVHLHKAFLFCYTMCNGVLFTVDKLYYVFVMSDASRHSTLRNTRGLRFKVLMMMMIFWVVTLYRVISKYQRFGKHVVPILWAKDGDSMFL